MVLVVEVGLWLEAERVTEVALLAVRWRVCTRARHYLDKLIIEVVDTRAHRNARTFLDLHHTEVKVVILFRTKEGSWYLVGPGIEALSLFSHPGSTLFSVPILIT
jgi:hypothetical protein